MISGIENVFYYFISSGYFKWLKGIVDYIYRILHSIKILNTILFCIMIVHPSPKISLGIIFFVMAFVISMNLAIFDFKSVNAQQGTEEIVLEKPNVDGKDELVVVSSINLQNVPKIGLIKVVGVINGEGFIKDIPLDQLDETTNKLKG